MSGRQQARMSDLPYYPLPSDVGEIARSETFTSWGWILIRASSLASDGEGYLWVREDSPVWLTHRPVNGAYALIVSGGPGRVSMWMSPEYYELIGKTKKADGYHPIHEILEKRPAWVL